jgi:hypothetical protein
VTRITTRRDSPRSPPTPFRHKPRAHVKFFFVARIGRAFDRSLAGNLGNPRGGCSPLEDQAEERIHTMAKWQTDSGQRMELVAYLEALLGWVQSPRASVGDVLAQAAAMRNNVLENPVDVALYQTNLKLAAATTTPMVHEVMRSYDDLIAEFAGSQRYKNGPAAHKASAHGGLLPVISSRAPFPVFQPFIVSSSSGTPESADHSSAARPAPGPSPPFPAATLPPIPPACNRPRRPQVRRSAPWR